MEGAIANIREGESRSRDAERGGGAPADGRVGCRYGVRGGRG